MSPVVSLAERRRQELRREIIDAAFDCFAEQGYHSTAIADIAARLGIGHGTFYRHFANKRDIVEHVVDDVVSRIIEALSAENAPEAAENITQYRAQVERIGEALGQILTEDPRLPRMLLEAPGIDPEMSAKVMAFYDLARSLTAQYLNHGVETDYLRLDLDVEATSDAIIGMIIAAMLTAVKQPEREHQRRLAAAIQTLMFEGIVD
ncbi:MAG TPA: TetR family transcriptional regulator [Marmoricola sp.]|nr:TetR family transcriptional regulator [Marmoricola sp.]HNJ78233.1 TetR family transcriptional regulator [Marmoricola sp.]